MSKIKIFTGENNTILRTKSLEIKSFDNALKAIIKKLKTAMLENEGLGIAMPQIGENIRAIIITLNHGGKNQILLPMINPEIIYFGEDTDVAEEGCLSLPGIYKKVERPREIKVKFRDLEGNAMMLNLEGLNAREVQHEVDHLDGILFIDRVKTPAQQTNF